MFNISLIIAQIPAAFLVLVIHESVKARCSTMLGDPTPKHHGLLQGNPLKYIEPIGFILTVLMGFGWGRPTPTSPIYYKDRVKGVLITFVTPSLVNLIIGLATVVFIGLLDEAVGSILVGIPRLLLMSFARINIAVALFNIIPVPPLDAAKVLQVFLSPNAAVKMTQNEKILQVVLMFLVLLQIISGIINPIVNTLVSVVRF